MTSIYDAFRTKAFLMLLASALTAHASWSRPSFNMQNWPDSTRLMAAAEISEPDGHLAADGLLIARDGMVYIPIFASAQDTGTSLGNDSVTSVAVLNDVCMAGTSSGRVYRNLRCNSNWLAFPAVLDSTVIRSIARRDSMLFLATDKGVFKQPQPFFDTIWIPASNGLTSLSVTRIHAKGQMLHAVTDSGIFASSNDGASWSALAPVHPSARIRDVTVSDGRLFAATEEGVYRSTDSGVSWNAFNAGLTDSSTWSFADTAGWVFVATGDGVYRAHSGDSAWIKVDSGLTSAPVYVLARSTYGLYAGRDDGIWRHSLYELITSGIHGSKGVNPAMFRVTGSNAVSFSLPVRSRVTLEAWLPNGSRAAVLLTEELPAGTHSRRLNTASLYNGLYFYRLHAGAVTETRKVVISR